MTDLKLWDFALRCYAAPGVEAACLAAQDDHGGDVPLLLYCLWSGRRGRVLSSTDIHGAAATVAPLQEQVIARLREARRALREEIAAPNRGAVLELREGLKTLELEAERCELEWLETMDQGRPSQDKGSAVTENIMAYLAFLDVTPRRYGQERIDSLISGAQLND